MRQLQRDLYQQLRVEAIDTRERIAALVRPLDPAKLNEHPEPIGWSVGQVLEHLCVADERYEAPLAALLARASKDAGAPAHSCRCMPPIPSGLSTLWSGPATKPSRDIEIVRRSLDTHYLPGNGSSSAVGEYAKRLQTR